VDKLVDYNTWHLKFAIFYRLCWSQLTMQYYYYYYYYYYY